MSTQDLGYDSNFVAQMQAASKRREDAAAPATPTGVNGSAVAVNDGTDPTFRYRRSLANIAEATMVRVVELETEAGKLADKSKNLAIQSVALLWRSPVSCARLW